MCIGILVKISVSIYLLFLMITSMSRKFRDFMFSSDFCLLFSSVNFIFRCSSFNGKQSSKHCVKYLLKITVHLLASLHFKTLFQLIFCIFSWNRARFFSLKQHTLGAVLALLVFSLRIRMDAKWSLMSVIKLPATILALWWPFVIPGIRHWNLASGIWHLGIDIKHVSWTSRYNRKFYQGGRAMTRLRSIAV